MEENLDKTLSDKPFIYVASGEVTLSMSIDEKIDHQEKNINEEFEIAYALCERFAKEYGDSEEYKNYKLAKDMWESDPRKHYQGCMYENSILHKEKNKELDELSDIIEDSKSYIKFISKLSMVNRQYAMNTDYWLSKKWGKL